MIKDKIENTDFYGNISENLNKGFKWLKNTDLENLENGRYYIDGNAVYANVQSYETKVSAPFEGHRKYIDIQYMVNGEEKIGITNYENCSTEVPYTEDNDIEFLKCDKNRNEISISSGEFAVFFPQDAHQPSLDSDKKRFVKKVIVKVAV